MRTKYLIWMWLLTPIFLTCSKDDVSNQVFNGNYPYEKYEVRLSGDVNDEYTFDESLYVAVDGNLDPIYETYLELVPSQNGGTDMVISLWPPPGHPLENNLIGIIIRSEDPEPWTFDRDYFPRHHNAIPYETEYAIVEYWDDVNSRHYVSRYTFQASNTKVELRREGDLLKGELRSCKLVTFNGQRQILLESLSFQVRPSDNALID